MRRWSIVLAAAFVLAPSATAACGNLNAYGRRIQAAREARFLQGARIVEGRWRSETDDDNNDGYRSGTILLMRGGHDTGRSIDASGHDEINCGFPLFPHDGDVGRFYLRREGGFWHIVHFIPSQEQHAIPRQESVPKARRRSATSPAPTRSLPVRNCSPPAMPAMTPTPPCSTSSAFAL